MGEAAIKDLAREQQTKMKGPKTTDIATMMRTIFCQRARRPHHAWKRSSIGSPLYLHVWSIGHYADPVKAAALIYEGDISSCYLIPHSDVGGRLTRVTTLTHGGRRHGRDLRSSIGTDRGDQ